MEDFYEFIAGLICSMPQKKWTGIFLPFVGVVFAVLIVVSVALFLTAATHSKKDQKWNLNGYGCIVLLASLLPFTYLIYKLMKLKCSVYSGTSTGFNETQSVPRGTVNLPEYSIGIQTSRADTVNNEQPVQQTQVVEVNSLFLQSPENASFELPPSYQSIFGQTERSMRNSSPD